MACHAGLAAALSNAGAWRVISPYAGMEKNGDTSKSLRNQIKKARNQTKNSLVSIYL